MRLWQLLGVLALAAQCLAASGGVDQVSGTLIQTKGKAPAIETADRRFVELAGDRDTLSVLTDTRLAGNPIQLRGHYNGSGSFVVEPRHTHSVFVVKDGKRLAVTYWCDLCSIRTYAPGPCMCCQRETELDLRDPDKE